MQCIEQRVRRRCAVIEFLYGSPGGSILAIESAYPPEDGGRSATSVGCHDGAWRLQNSSNPEPQSQPSSATGDEETATYQVMESQSEECQAAKASESWQDPNTCMQAVTAEQTVLEAPTIQRPEVMNKPDIQEPNVIMEAPSIQEPEVVEEPDTQEPEVIMDKPDIREPEVITEQSDIREPAVVLEAPEDIMETPDIQEPAVLEAPDIREPEVITEQSDIREPTVIMEQPGIREPGVLEEPEIVVRFYDSGVDAMLCCAVIHRDV